MPARMISHAPIPSVPRTASRTAVPPMARAMPPAETRLPLRAVAGEFIRMRPMTKPAAPTSQVSRTSDSMRARVSGLRFISALALGLLGGRRGLALEHLEHPVGDDVAPDDVHRRERHRDEAQDL